MRTLAHTFFTNDIINNEVWEHDIFKFIDLILDVKKNKKLNKNKIKILKIIFDNLIFFFFFKIEINKDKPIS
jgi:hypothetical protein